jgi:hypothetical protein
MEHELQNLGNGIKWLVNELKIQEREGQMRGAYRL